MSAPISSDMTAVAAEKVWLWQPEWQLLRLGFPLKATPMPATCPACCQLACHSFPCERPPRDRGLAHKRTQLPEATVEATSEATVEKDRFHVAASCSLSSLLSALCECQNMDIVFSCSTVDIISLVHHLGFMMIDSTLDFDLVIF